MMGFNENPQSWLFDEIPNDDRVIHFFNPEKKKRKELFYKVVNCILGPETQLNYAKLRSIYMSSLNQFNIQYTTTYEGINDNQRKKVIEDMTRTLCKIRYDFYPDSKPPNDREKKLFCAILRITLSLHYEKNPEINLFKYIQSIIELILPIYHIVWCSFDYKETYAIEALTKYLFKKFMKKTHQIDIIPGSISFQEHFSEFELYIKKNERTIYNIFVSNNIQFLIPFKWYSLIFTQEFNFDDVNEVWIYLFNQNIDNFSENLKNICIHIFKKISKEISKRKDDKQFIMQSIQDIKHIGIQDIIHEISQSDKSKDKGILKNALTFLSSRF